MKGDTLKWPSTSQPKNLCDDVFQVVKELKQTSKGKLNYGNELDFKKLSLPVSPSIPLHTLPINQNQSLHDLSTNVKNKEVNSIGSKYKDYLTSSSQHLNNDTATIAMPSTSATSSNKECMTKQKSLDRIHDTSAMQSEIYVQKTQEMAVLARIYEQQYEATLARLSQERLERLQAVLGELQVEHDDALNEIEDDIQRKLSTEERSIKQQENLASSSSEQELRIFRQLHTNHAGNTETKLKCVERDKAEISRRQLELSEERHRVDLYTKQLEALAMSLPTVTGDLQMKLDCCRQRNVRPSEVMALFTELRGLHVSCEETIHDGLSKQEDLPRKIEYVNSVVNRLESMTDVVSGIIQEEEKRVQERARKALSEELKRKTAEEEQEKLRQDEEARKVAAAVATTPDQPIQPVPRPLATSSAIPGNVSATVSTASSSTATSADLDCVSQGALNEHTRLMKLLGDTVQSYNKIKQSKDKVIKSFEFDLSKAVNTTVNSISDQSPTDLLQKIARLSNLIMGREVDIGAKKISTAGQPAAVALCKDLFARKLMKQGCEQVSSNFSTAFSFAAVAVSVAAMDRGVTDLVVANFYKKCPLLVPYYIPHKPGQTKQEHYEELGYDVTSSGEVEDTERYLKKLSGVVRLYAALVQAELPPQITTATAVPHPHGIENGWIWFTRIMNLEPRASVTAVVIFDFLSVAGHALMRRYGKQFQKLLRVLCSEYVPRIVAVTPPEARAYTERLKIYLEECIKTGQLKVPEGHLSAEWWTM